MQVTRYRKWDQNEALRTAWDRLADRVPFRGWDWCSTWWNCYGQAPDNESRELFLLVAHEGDQILGIAPWVLSRTMAQGKVLQFLASGEVCSDYLTVLVQENHRTAVCRAISSWLSDTPRLEDQWDLLLLEGVEDSDANVTALQNCLELDGNQVLERPGVNCWRIELPATWEDYLARLSKSHRKQIRRIERRVLEPGLAKLQTVTSESQLVQGLDNLIDLHQRRRRSLGEAGCFASRRFKSFMEQVSARFLRTDQLGLHWLEWDSKPIAAELHFRSGGVTFAYQAGVDPACLGVEPGRIIIIATVKQAIAEGQTAFDFLRGDEQYKAHFRAEPRASKSVMVVPNRRLARVRHRVRLAGYGLRNYWKSGLEMMGQTKT